MFELEPKIAAWRESFAQQRLDELTLAELESHLRELFAMLKRSKMDDEQAWQKAITSLGDAKQIAAEFRKTPKVVWWPTLFVIGLVVFCTCGTIAVMLKRGIHSGIDLLLLFHVTAITVGYTAMFATGLLAICAVLQRLVRRWDAPRDDAFYKCALIFSAVASIMVTVGILLGCYWTLQTRHALWNWDAREIGAALVLAWAVTQCEIFRRPLLPVAVRLTAGLVANMITSAAWFGPIILEARHSYGNDAFGGKLVGFMTANAVLVLVAYFLPQSQPIEAT